MQFDVEYNRRSQPADTSNTDLRGKRRSVGKWTKMALILSSGNLILEVMKRQVLLSYYLQGLRNCRKNVIWLQLSINTS
jgi:hypothetical protein